ncbi:MAG: hypothetical protein ACTHK1_02910 [Actinomycetales bacterium]
MSLVPSPTVVSWLTVLRFEIEAADARTPLDVVAAELEVRRG